MFPVHVSYLTLLTTVYRDASAQNVEGTQKVNDLKTSMLLSLALSLHCVFVHCKRLHREPKYTETLFCMNVQYGR
jgi:hypothetical protein